MRNLNIALVIALLTSCGVTQSTTAQDSTVNQYCGSSLGGPPYYSCQPGYFDNCSSECQSAGFQTGYCPEQTWDDWWYCTLHPWEILMTGDWRGLWRCYDGEPVSPKYCISGYEP